MYFPSELLLWTTFCYLDCRCVTPRAQDLYFCNVKSINIMYQIQCCVRAHWTNLY